MTNIEQKDCVFQHLDRVGWSSLLLTTAVVFVTLFFNVEAAPVETRQPILESGAVSSPVQRRLNSRIASSPTTRVGNDETGYLGPSSFERPSSTIDGWQYCLAISKPEKKVFISPVFQKNTDLKLMQALFAEELAQAEHDPVQCPVSKYPGTIRVMRENGIEFNRKVGNAIISLNWEPFSLPTDEDPIEAAIYTGVSSSEDGQDHPGWRYCFARSDAENKIYFTPPFPKASTLYADEKQFASKLNQLKLKFDTVQCPTSIDEASTSEMRARAIGFNQERGQRIVTLNSDSQS